MSIFRNILYRQLNVTLNDVASWDVEVTAGTIYGCRVDTSGTAIVDWGDGTSTTNTSSGELLHTYSEDGIYTVVISGSIYHFQLNGEWSSDYGKYVSTVNFLNTGHIEDFSRTFEKCTNIKNIPAIDASNGINMLRMFAGCKNLLSIPALNTSNITSVNGIFENCQNVIDFPWLDTSRCTNFHNVFYGCSKITTIPALDLSNATTLYQFCQSCSNLTSLPSMNTSNVTIFQRAFNSCTKLTLIPDIDTSKGTDFKYMYTNNENMSGVADPSKYWNNPTAAEILSGSQCFRNCTSLSNYDDIPSNWK